IKGSRRVPTPPEESPDRERREQEPDEPESTGVNHKRAAEALPTTGLVHPGQGRPNIQAQAGKPHDNQGRPIGQTLVHFGPPYIRIRNPKPRSNWGSKVTLPLSRFA